MPARRSDTVRLLAVLVVGLLVSAGGGLWLQSGRAARASDNPVHRVVGATTTTAVALDAFVVPTTAAPKPVDPPSDGYANEPVSKIGTIEIPKIGLVHPIYHGITLNNIDQGPSHWPGTALPGENGNTVFAGHRVTHTHPFRDIDQLVPGDQVIFTVNGVRSVYVVTGHEVVVPTTLSIVNPTATPTGTLFACHPPHSASYRYVVHLALLAS
jgi:sortase A